MHFKFTTFFVLISFFSSILAAEIPENTDTTSSTEDSDEAVEILGCKNFGRCCQGKDSTCFVQNKLARNENESELKNCYCDAECAITGDCCHDHKQFCKAVDCNVSEWSSWSSCSKLCGHGNQTRTRTIFTKAHNGGMTCPVLDQMRKCIGEDCNIKRDVGRRALKETGRVLPIRFAMHRTSSKYDIRKGIRKNLYDYYHSQNSILSKPTYCAFYEITYSRPHCRRPQFGEWAKVMKRGARMCVECQSSAMYENGHCKGDGVEGRDTRWKAVGVSSCSGWWRLDTQPKECTCNARENTSFIFV